MRSAQYYSTQHQVIIPTEFKKNIDLLDGRFASGQHDAEEFLTFILNAIHEDLDRVKRKDISYLEEGEDYFGINQQQACEDALVKTRLRNNSIVTDNLDGMLRCTTNCSICHKTRVKIESFTILPLQIPQDQEGGRASERTSEMKMKTRIAQTKSKHSAQNPRTSMPV